MRMAKTRSGTVKPKSKPREYVELIVSSVLLALVIRAFVIQAFRIPSGSMEDTLLVGDFLLVNKFLYGAEIPFTDTRLPAIRQPKRGDIIVFRSPHPVRGKPRDLIKRCIAVEGDVVEVKNNRVYINGAIQDEPYVKTDGPRSPYANAPPVLVPKDHIFMMGDNRNNSTDSRAWGVVHKGLIRGKAMIMYFSWDLRLHGPWHWPRIWRIGKLIR
jgi:signal peptidase I